MKRKTHVVETRKQEEKKETTDELMDEQKRTQRGRKEVMHACERDNSKSLIFEPKKKNGCSKKKKNSRK